MKQAQAGGYCINHAKEYAPDDHKKLLSKVKSCKVERCIKYPQTSGYCQVHAKQRNIHAYNRLRSRQSCVIDGCMITAEVDGYCSKHAEKEAHRKFRLRVNKSKADRMESEPRFKLRERLRRRMHFELKRVGTSYKGKLTLIGCSVDQLCQYFEQNHFQEEGNEWMNWENWGGGRCHVNLTWEVDHIMPISSFDLSDPEERKKCFHWSNLQPLSWPDNMKKGDSIPEDFEWCYVKERWLWGEASGKTNYNLPSVEEDDLM